MKIVRLWCDDKQAEKVKDLTSCFLIKKGKARVADGRLVDVYKVIGGDSILSDIDSALGK